MEKEQTTQWPKEKEQKTIYKTYTSNERSSNTNPTKTGVNSGDPEG
jgi:hypothetical protein